MILSKSTAATDAGFSCAVLTAFPICLGREKFYLRRVIQGVGTSRCLRWALLVDPAGLHTSCSYCTFPPPSLSRLTRHAERSWPLHIIVCWLVEYAPGLGRFWLLPVRLSESRSNPAAPETSEWSRPRAAALLHRLLRQRCNPLTFIDQSSRSICCAGAPWNEGCQPVCRPT